MGCGPKAAAEDADREELTKEVYRFAAKSPMQVLTQLRAMDECLKRLNPDEMRLTGLERYNFERVWTLLRDLRS
jgi:hypothetical protein